MFLKLICKMSILEIISDLQNIGLGIPLDRVDILKTWSKLNSGRGTAMTLGYQKRILSA